MQGRRAADDPPQFCSTTTDPPAADLTRYRIDLVNTRGAEKNRVEKLLEDACIKVSVVASDIFGVSGRDMMAALIAGQRDPKVLAQLARSRMRTKITLLEEAFTGHFTDHHAFLLTRMLGRIDAINTDIAAIEERINEVIAPFTQAVARLDDIPGVGPVAAAVIIAEVGVDMSRFPTPGHLVSWARFAPGVKESAGRKKGNAATGHANRYLARILGTSRCRCQQDQHFPGRTLSTHRQTTRQKTCTRRGRPLHPGHRLAPTRRPREHLPRPWPRLLQHPNRTRAPQTQPHPPTRSTRLHSHPATSRLTTASPVPARHHSSASAGGPVRPSPTHFRISYLCPLRWATVVAGKWARIAMAAARTKDNTYLGARYQRLAPRLGKKKALVALEHTILTAVWHMLTDNIDYHDLGGDYFTKLDPERAMRRITRQANALGYTVRFDPIAA